MGWSNAGWRSDQGGWYKNASGIVAYAGPGDVVSFGNWWGLRGYSAAYSTGSNPAADLVDQAGANSVTINILADGTLDVASIAAWVTAHTVTTIKVKKLYDQVASDHLTQATLASMPSLVLGPVTGLAASRPAMLFSGSHVLMSTSTTYSQPISYSGVSQRTNTADGAVIGGTTANDAEMRFGPTTNNQIFIFAGGTPTTQAAADNSWHSLTGIFNGASSLMNVDGSSGSTANAGSNGVTAFVNVGNNAFGSFLTGYVQQIGIKGAALSGANMTSLSSQDHSYWGF